jgi:cysteinyl-tRNA synthetase
VFTIDLETGQWFAAAKFLGFLSSTPRSWFQGDADGEAIEARIAQRATAKEDLKFAIADRIRDELKAEGIMLEDGPDGTTWRRA